MLEPAFSATEGTPSCANGQWLLLLQVFTDAGRSVWRLLAPYLRLF